MSLKDKKIIVGVTGGIAAYKAAYLIRLIRTAGGIPTVIMTENAENFITPLTMQALSGRPVFSKLFHPESNNGIDHTTLASTVDAIVIAPATANTIAKIRCGLADNMLSATILASSVPILIAPAMNHAMWINQATQENIKILKERGFFFIGPDSGFQACGTYGVGRMSEPDEIFNELNKILESKEKKINKPLSGKKVLITSGPTIEPLDKVRYLTNRSSGKMGRALAEAAISMGADTVVITGPAKIAPPEKAKIIRINTACEMEQSVLKELKGTNIFIACAAVSDFRPEHFINGKIKKQTDVDHIDLKLVKNPDILAEVGHSPCRPDIVIGFAAETTNIDEYAKDKLIRKNADFIAANNVSSESTGFNSDQNNIVLFTKFGKSIDLGTNNKKVLAEKILNEALTIQKL